jgi:hypothetical protein
MIQTVTFSDFCDSFSDQYKDNFTYEGKRALFDYLEELEEETEKQIELDPIALCCEYTEYEDLKELKKDYSEIETMEQLKNKTTVIEIGKTDRFIIACY